MMKMVIGDELAEWRMEGDTSSGASGHLPQRGTFGSAGDEGIAPTGGAAAGFINSQFPGGAKVIRRAVLHFGPRRQMVKAMEELGELIQAIARYVGAKDEGAAGGFEVEGIAEEIADVEIMLQQVRIICDIAPELEGIWRERKLRRLMGRMDRKG